MSTFVFRFGKHQGAYVTDVPQDYLEWLVKDGREKLAIYEAELDRRRALELDAMPMVEKLVQAGYRALATKYHPDKGGQTADFQALHHSRPQLLVGRLRRSDEPSGAGIR